MIQPRFPLFGGWRTNYVLGYNLPGYQYLYSSGSSFALKMRFMDHLFDNAVIENIKVRIILPEGSKFVLQLLFFPSFFYKGFMDLNIFGSGYFTTNVYL